MSLLHFENVDRRYPSGDRDVVALRAIDLRIERGEFVTLWGPSGSGKTTLCNLAGMLDDPTSGRVWFAGEAAGALDDDTRAVLRNRELGFVFQSFNLMPVLSAIENVMLPLEIQGVRPGQCRARALELLEELEVAAEASRLPDRLSGGQRQRVAIARALVTEPALVIADEPTANLDSRTAQRIVRMMREARRRHGTCFLVSTHDERLLDEDDRRIRLEDGRVVEDVNANRAGEKAPALP